MHLLANLMAPSNTARLWFAYALTATCVCSTAYGTTSTTKPPEVDVVRPAQGPGVDARVVERFRDGKPRRVEHRKKGKIVDVTHLFRDGKLQHVMAFGPGPNQARVTVYHPSGVPSKTFPLVRGVANGVMVTFDAEGKKASKMPHVDGKPHGLERQLRASGEIKATSMWANGLRQGPFTTYYSGTPAKRESEILYSKGVPASSGRAWWPSGRIKARFELSSGLKHGEEERFSDTAPAYRSATYRYAYGQLHGLADTYWPDGTKATEVTYRYGQATGLERHWHKNGQVAFEVQRRSDLRHGTAQLWQADGQLVATLPYVDGRLHGTETRFYAGSGAMRATFNWKQGAMTGFAYVFRDAKANRKKGVLLAKIPMKKGAIHGVEQRFHPDGKTIWMKVSRNQGLVDGTVHVFRLDGSLERINRYRTGQQHGATELFDHSGKVRLAAYEFSEGKPSGLAKQWWPKGQLRRQWPWAKGATGQERRWHPNGQLHWQVPIVGGTRNGHQEVFAKAGWRWADRTWQDDVMSGTERRFYRSGQLMGEYPVVDGVWQGRAKVYAKRGGWLWSNRPYDKGQLHGRETRFTKNGKKWAYYYWKRGKLVGKKFLRRRRPRDPNVKRYRDGRIVYYYEGTTTPRRELRPTSVKGVTLERLFWPNGALRLEAPLREGKRNGEASFWHDDGALHARVDFVSGVRNGSEVRYFATGEKKLEIPFRQDQPVGYARTFYRNGTIQSRYPVGASKKGVEVQYHRNGAVRMTVPMKKGKRHGFGRFQDPYGRGVARLSYLDGEREGVEVQYHHNGRVRMVVPLRSGQRSGRALIRTQTGKRWADIPYRSGLKHGVERRFGPSGTHITEERDYRDGVALEKRSFVSEVRGAEPLPPPPPR